jgi:predicted lysophospholipase L1 biosynthesis ABC-type transport system permease subunit
MFVERLTWLLLMSALRKQPGREASAKVVELACPTVSSVRFRGVKPDAGSSLGGALDVAVEVASPLITAANCRLLCRLDVGRRRRHHIRGFALF